MCKPTKKGQSFPIWKCHVTIAKKDEYIGNELQLQNLSLTFIHKNKSLLSATSIQSRSPMSYNTTASLGKLNCTNYVDFAKCQNRFGQFFWSKNDSNYLKVKLKVFKKGDNKEFRLVQNLTMGETDFNQFMRWRNWMVFAAEKYAREENLSPMVIQTLFKDMDEQLKLAYKVGRHSGRSKQKDLYDCIAVQCGEATGFLCSVRLFARKKEDKKFQQIVYVRYEVEEFIHFFDVMNSVYDKIITNQPICNDL